MTRGTFKLLSLLYINNLINSHLCINNVINSHDINNFIHSHYINNFTNSHDRNNVTHINKFHFFTQVFGVILNNFFHSHDANKIQLFTFDFLITQLYNRSQGFSSHEDSYKLNLFMIIAIPHYEFGYDNIVYWFIFGSNNLTLGY